MKSIKRVLIILVAFCSLSALSVVHADWVPCTWQHVKESPKPDPTYNGKCLGLDPFKKGAGVNYVITSDSIHAFEPAGDLAKCQDVRSTAALNACLVRYNKKVYALSLCAYDHRDRGKVIACAAAEEIPTP